TAANNDSSVERIARLVRWSGLAERRSEPAIDQREVGIEPDHPLRGIDGCLVVMGEIVGNRHAVEVPWKQRIARIEPNAGWQRDEPLAWFTGEDQGCSQRAVRARQVGADCQRPLSLA